VLSSIFLFLRSESRSSLNEGYEKLQKATVYILIGIVVCYENNLSLNNKTLLCCSVVVKAL
jgi:hypothetical protein